VLADKHQFQLWALSTIEAQPYKGGKKGADNLTTGSRRNSPYT
jgi:site-specific DNA-methyltransferase (adenine-specific)